MNIKGMDKNMRCRGFQFKIGKEYKIETDKPLKLCTDTVFHYCKNIKDLNSHYSCETDNRFFEIEVLGEEVGDGKKYGSNHIKILREIKGQELDYMLGKINGNTGVFNSGNWNSGHCNSGNRNSGNWNSGDCNSGHCNSGDCNSGNRNSGDCNSGHCNSGDRNSGDYNSGNYNSRGRNSGDYNSGYRNTGDGNSGDGNSGDGNSGYNNSGYMNSGDYNSGIANSCDDSNGVFCSEPDTNIRIFNKPSGMSLKDFYDSCYWEAMCSVPFNLTEWIPYTKEEMESDYKKKLTGGYLKKYTCKEAWANWWSKMTEENKQIIMSIPNFDKAIFKEITGIEV